MIPRVMTVAGSDSGGGAGIQADIKTLTSLNVFATSVIVALTAQNSHEVTGILPVSEEFVGKQMDAILSDMGTDSAKTGMLFSSEIIHTVYKKFVQYDVKNVVIDPVMISKSGAILLKDDALKSLMDELGKIATLITPNIPEGERMSGISIKNMEDRIRAARKIYEITGSSVLLKGGHSSGDYSTDILYTHKGEMEITRKRIHTDNTHGTGDTYSSAIAAYLARGKNLEDSVNLARDYLQGAIENSFPMGRGYGSLCHFWKDVK